MGTPFRQQQTNLSSTYNYLDWGYPNFNIDSTNLNEWSIPDDEFYKANPNRSQLENYSTQSGDVEVIFRNIENRLIEEIHKASAVVGCVAWLTSAAILQALSFKYCQLIVQKEDFLRPDIGARSNWKQQLRGQYDALGKVDKWSLPGTISRMSYGGESDIEAVRCVGNYNRDKNPAFPRMHNKFLIFGDFSFRGDDEYPVMDPNAVWTGSFNLTKNAGFSLENALIIRDKKIVNAYAQEYGQIAGLSEPLDWRSDWCSPQFRIGS